MWLAVQCLATSASSLLKAIRPSRLVVIAIIVMAHLLLANCRSVLTGAINAPARMGFHDRRGDVRYGNEHRHSLDVYVPSGASKRPVVVFWYGGFWRIGRKEQYRFVGAALAEAGYIAILPDYRLSPHVRFPQFIEDGAHAVKWAREHAHELGGDPHAIFLMGHSAGAHLAATLALDERYFEKIGGDSSWVRGWIAVSAPYELQWLLPWIAMVFDASTPELWRPIALVRKGAPPALLVHGLEDGMIHPQEVVNMTKRLRAVGVPVDCRIYEEVGHAQTVLALSPLLRFRATTLADVREFIDRTIAGDTLQHACPGISGRKNWQQLRPQPHLTHAP